MCVEIEEYVCSVGWVSGTMYVHIMAIAVTPWMFLCITGTYFFS